MGLYPCINISQTFHKPYINNRRRQNCVFFLLSSPTPLHSSSRLSTSSEYGCGEEDGTSRSLSLSENLLLLFWLAYWLKGINQILNTIRAEEDPREHKQQARPCHEERQVHSRFQDRPPISPQLKRFFFYCVKCCWYVFCSFDFVVIFFFKLFLDSILNIGDWFLLVGEMQGSW